MSIDEADEVVAAGSGSQLRCEVPSGWVAQDELAEVSCRLAGEKQCLRGCGRARGRNMDLGCLRGLDKQRNKLLEPFRLVSRWLAWEFK